MAEHEELHDEDVIVVMTNEDGDELYYRDDYPHRGGSLCRAGRTQCFLGGGS